VEFEALPPSLNAAAMISAGARRTQAGLDFLNHFSGALATKIAEQLRRAALASIHKSQMRCE
jgi:hypothetical protein